MAYGDFMQNAKFVVMYNGSLHTLTPTADQNGGKLIAPDTQMIAYWEEWATPSDHEDIFLTPGRADWRLIAIYTDGDYYQLKPRDLIGLIVSNDFNAIATKLNGGLSASFVIDDILLSVSKSNEDNSFNYKEVNCSPAVTGKVTSLSSSMSGGDYIINSYSCEDYVPMSTEIRDFLINRIGYQPAQVTSVIDDGMTDTVEVPLAIAES